MMMIVMMVTNEDDEDDDGLYDNVVAYDDDDDDNDADDDDDDDCDDGDEMTSTMKMRTMTEADLYVVHGGVGRGVNAVGHSLQAALQAVRAGTTTLALLQRLEYLPCWKTDNKNNKGHRTDLWGSQ